MSTQTNKIRTPNLILMRSLFIITVFYCLRSTRLVLANDEEESFCEKRLREYDEDRRDYRTHCVYNSGDQSPSCCNVIKESLEDRVLQYRILCPHEGRILLPNKTDVASSILNGTDAKFVEQIEQWLPVKMRWHLCYRATKDGWAASDFHSRCDNKGATITVIRVGKYIFGGYNDLSWTGGSGGFKSSSNAFLFSLRNKDNLKPFKAPVYRSQYAIYDNSGYGPIFGGGNDLYIANNAHSSTGSYTEFGHTYQPPSGYSHASSNTRALLAGSYYFTPSEVEVFYFG